MTGLDACVHTEAPSALQVGHGESASPEIIIETDPAVDRYEDWPAEQWRSMLLMPWTRLIGFISHIGKIHVRIEMIQM